MRLYPWQKNCLKEWRDNEFHGIVHVVTGAGKTVMALGAIRLLQKSCSFPICVRVVVPTASLARQWTAAMRRFLPDCASGVCRPGQYGGGRKDRADRRYMVYVVNSAREVLPAHILQDLKKGRGVLLIADECHHYASPENRNIFQFLKSRVFLACPAVKERYFSLGLSATPWIAGYDSVLVPALGKEIYRYGFKEAAHERMVCPFAVYQIALSFTAEEMQSYDAYGGQLRILQKRLFQAQPFLMEMDRQHFFAYLHRQAAEDPESLAARFLNLLLARSQITYMARARSACVLDLIKELGLSRQILIFGERIEQTEAVYRELCRLYGNRVGRYHSALPSAARRQILERFQTGEIRILAACRALDEGVDVPAASVGIILSGASVNRQRVQRLGRILRKNEGKSMACMYYLYVKESAEESAFLVDAEDNFPVCSLSYEIFDHAFCHPAYEEAAAGVLDRIGAGCQDAEVLRELRRCLLAGLIRPDWLAAEEEIEGRIRQAQSRQEKNYWICMREMRRQNPLSNRQTMLY